MMPISTRRRGRGMWVVVGALVTLAAGAALLWREPLSAVVAELFSPLLHSRFAGDPRAAEVQLGLMRAAIADREALYQENLDLKSRLGRDARPNALLAGVLLRPPATPYDTLLIDAGEAEGVHVGDVVAAGGTLVVGTVSDLYPHTARVTLLSAPGERYNALLQTSKGSVPIEIEGEGGGSLRAQLPSGSAVRVGDYAVLPGIYGGLTASVTAVASGASDSYITIYFTVPINAATIRYVEVWKTL